LRGFAREPQTLYDAPSQEVLLQDLLHILPVNIGIPDALRIDCDHRTFRAPVHAARRIDANTARPRDAELLAAAFKVVTHRLRVALGATLAAILAEIRAEKDVMSVVGHGAVSLLESLGGRRDRLPL
jgi:hypothetical protein